MGRHSLLALTFILWAFSNNSIDFVCEDLGISKNLALFRLLIMAVKLLF